VKPAGPRRRLAATATVAVAIAAAAAAGLAPRNASAARSPTPTPSAATASSTEIAQHRVAITLTTLTPKVLRPHDVLALDGFLLNTSGRPLTNVAITVRASSRRITTRYDLAREADPAVVLGTTLSSTRQVIGTLAAGQSIGWHFTVPVQRLGLPTSVESFGAFPLAVDVRSSLDGTGLTTRLPTSVMWMPEGAQPVPTQISWLVPLVDGIHRGNGTTFLNDALARDLAKTGRLSQLLHFAAAATVPLTYVIDPALVDDVAAMAGPTDQADRATAEPSGTNVSASPKPTAKPTQSKPSASLKPSASAKPSGSPAAPGKTTAGTSLPAAAPTYQVITGNGTADGTGQPAARAWLAVLRQAVAAPGAAVVGLPYGDTDVVAVERAGLAKEIGIARATGQSALSANLGPPTLPNTIWPINGVLDDSTLDELANDLVDAVVLTDQALPPRDINAVTGARANLQTASGTVHAVLTDSTIATLLDAPQSAAGGSRVVEQRFLAETMLITEQRPGSGSAVVVAPPRDWDVSSGFAATLLADSATMPWLQGVNLGQVAALPADGVPRTSLVYPELARAAEVRGSDLAPIAGLRGDLTAFGAILGATTTATSINASSIALLRAESGSLRNKPTRSAAIQAAVRSDLATQTARVYIIKPGLITLTSRKQKIPITVVNNLPDPVTVQVRLTALNAARLTVTPQQAFTMPGNQSRHEVLVEVEATTGGRFDVQAQLWTPEATPRPYGSTVPFVLNSTAYGAVALTIAASAAGLVFVLSAIRLIRRVRHKRHPDAAAGGSPGGEPGLDDGNLGGSETGAVAETADVPLTP
jgi:hypothetical protein